MLRLIIFLLILVVLGVGGPGCASSKKTDRALRSLMIQENTKLGRNKAYYSKHNKRTRRIAHRKYKKNKIKNTRMQKHNKL